jgi:hypothetical protein
MRSVSTLSAIGAAALIAILAVAGCGLGDSSPSPTPIPSPNTDELYLISGIRSDAAIGCVPIRSALPAGATAAVQCAPNEGAVDRFRVTLFTSTNDVLALYLAEMTAHGVALNSLGCVRGNGEATYIPGPDDASVPYRNGCFVTEVANFRAIDAGGLVYIAIVGKSPDVSGELDAYAWWGNLDAPGAPTLWRGPA